MSSLTISRAERFVRGDESVGIFVNGNAVGALLGESPLVVEFADLSPRRVQAFMNGSKGAPVDLLPGSGEKVYITVSGTRRIPETWRENLVSFVLWLVVGFILPALNFWLFVAGLTLMALIEAARWRKSSRRFLKLEVAQEPASEREILFEEGALI